MEFKVGKDKIEINDKVISFNGSVKNDWSISYVGDDIVGVHDNKNMILYSTFKNEPIKTVDKESITL